MSDHGVTAKWPKVVSCRGCVYYGFYCTYGDSEHYGERWEDGCQEWETLSDTARPIFEEDDE